MKEEAKMEAEVDKKQKEKAEEKKEAEGVLSIVPLKMCLACLVPPCIYPGHP